MKPASLSEVFNLLERYGEEAKILAGGQSLMPALNMRLSSPTVLIDINGVGDLSGVTLQDGRLRIGALTRHRSLERSGEIAQHAPLIALAMPHVAHAAIRNRGTFGGSIAFADPAAELPACAVALDANFVLAGSEGERRVPARGFFTNLYTTQLRPDELLVAGEIPVRRPSYRSAFIELARRHGDYAIVGVAAHGAYENEMFRDVSMVFFGVGATPILAKNVTATLEGQRYSRDLVAAAQDAVDSDVTPDGDLYQSAVTKLHFARVLAGRVIAQLASGN